MKVIFRFQDVSEIVSDGVPALEVNANDAQQAVHKERRKKDGKGLFLIHQCVDPNVFEKIIEEETAKGAWDKLKSLYGGDEKLKRVKLQTLRKQFETTQMKEDESVSDYLSRIVVLTNKMKACGEAINDLQKIEKVLRSLTANFDYIVVSIEESKNLSEMKLEELQASLEAHEMRLKQRNSEREKVAEQALQARFKKSGKDKGKSLANDEKSSKNSKNQSDSTKKGMGNKYSGKKVDMKEVQCYKCQGLGHYARDCRKKKEAQAIESDEVQYAYAEEVILKMCYSLPSLCRTLSKLTCGIWILDAAIT